MTEARASTVDTWRTLVAEGHVSGDALTFEAFFDAPDEQVARALVDVLDRHGWQAVLSRVQQGLFRRRTRWGATASRRLEALTVPDLDALVAELETLATSHGAEFDGWGAHLPS